MSKNADRTKKPSISERMEQLGSLAGFIVDFLATLLSFEQVNYWLGHKTELKKKLREVFSVNIVEFVSKFFQKTNVINITKSPGLFMIGENPVMSFLEPVIRREKESGSPDPYIDNDLWNYFKGKIIPGFLIDFTSVIYRFLVNLTHKQILDEAETTGIKKVYTYLEGLSIIRQAILNGEVDKKGTGVVVYFKVEGIDSLYRFYAYRYVGGQLKVRVLRVYLDFEWSAGDGACFS
jgi:hypothetical protein